MEHVYLPVEVERALDNPELVSKLPSLKPTAEALLTPKRRLNDMQELCVFKVLRDSGYDFDSLVGRFCSALGKSLDSKGVNTIRRWLRNRGFRPGGIPVALITRAREFYKEIGNTSSVKAKSRLANTTKPRTGKKVGADLARAAMAHVVWRKTYATLTEEMVFLPQEIEEKLNEPGLKLPSFESAAAAFFDPKCTLDEQQELAVFKELKLVGYDYVALADSTSYEGLTSQQVRKKFLWWLNNRAFYKDGVPLSLIERARELYEELDDKEVVVQHLIDMINPATGKKVVEHLAVIIMTQLTRYTPEGKSRSKAHRMGIRLEVQAAEFLVSEGFADNYDYIPRGRNAPTCDLSTNRGMVDIKSATFRTGHKTLNQYLSYNFNQPVGTVYLLTRVPRDGKYRYSDEAYIGDEYYGIVTDKEIKLIHSKMEGTKRSLGDGGTYTVSIAESGPPKRATKDFPSNVDERGVKWTNLAGLREAFRALPLKK